MSIQLSTREFQLMEYLMRHPRQVLSHDQIEHALWEWGTEPESNAVTTLVRRLRQRLHAVGAKALTRNRLWHELSLKLQARKRLGDLVTPRLSRAT